jgi:hypothetical protein
MCRILNNNLHFDSGLLHRPQCLRQNLNKVQIQILLLNDDNEFDNIRPVFRRSNSCPPNLVSNLKSDDLRITLFWKRYNNV